MLSTFSRLLWLGVLTFVIASNSEITDKDVDNFKAGMDALKKTAQGHTSQEKYFDPSLYQVETDNEQYDFIIIGAGAAGSVIANYLSENLQWKILLVEAGGPETPYTQVPQLGYLLGNTDYNWAYVTTPQETWCQGMINNQCSLAGGKALGGGTAINGMVYTRGNAKDFDLWSKLGNEGWAFKDVLPYFKKMEDADLKIVDEEYHNHGGPFHVEHVQYLTDLTNISLAAGEELGFKEVDVNGKEQIGLSIIQMNTKHGKRQSTAQAYLEPVRTRPNLSIKAFSHVTKILIDSDTKVATGVAYLHDDKLYVSTASKEIILCAGTINTPQILMLSGIGPKEELEKFDIPLIKDLNVGRNLKNHVGFYSLDFIYNTTDNAEHDDGDEVVQYLKEGKGPLTSAGYEVLGYIQTDVSKNKVKRPDIELFISAGTISAYPSINALRLKEEVYDSLWGPVDNKRSINIGVILLHPKSNGTVTLKDKDPLHHPLVDPNQLSDPHDEDINTLLAGIRKAISFIDTKAMKKLNLYVNNNKVAGCREHTWGTDDYWKCAIRHLSINLRHVLGTARMGPESDKEAVVNNKLEVYGVHNLRVADASVVPVTITGHTMAVAIMIGEKASTLIKEKWM